MTVKQHLGLVHITVLIVVHSCNMRLYSAEEPAYMNACPEHMPIIVSASLVANVLLSQNVIAQ